MNEIAFTDFGRRQFDSNFGGTKITMPEDEFLAKISTRWNSTHHQTIMLPGYASFCKLMITDNFMHAPTGTLEITNENYQYLRSCYEARNENELAVLKRWFELPLPAPEAKSLCVVFYDKQQIEKEEQIQNESFWFNGDWGIVSVMAQQSFQEEPMAPITMMRNALGIEEGGSGVALDKRKYQYAVDFWQNHAIVK